MDEEIAQQITHLKDFANTISITKSRENKTHPYKLTATLLWIFVSTSVSYTHLSLSSLDSTLVIFSSGRIKSCSDFPAAQIIKI